jgi:ribosomal protein S19
MEGMEHLLPGKTPLSVGEAQALAEKLQLSTYKLDQAGVNRLSRVAAILQENPEVVNSKLAIHDAKLYYQVIHDHAEVFALDLGDLEQPAITPPF